MLKRLTVASSAATGFYLWRKSALPEQTVLELDAPSDASAHLTTVKAIADASTDPPCKFSSLDEKACRLSTWRAMLQVLDEGKARAVGVSNYNISHLDAVLQAHRDLSGDSHPETLSAMRNVASLLQAARQRV